MVSDKFKRHRVVVQGQGPGTRYGHAMDLVAQRYLVTVSGNDGKRVLSDAWALDTAQKPYAWQKLNPEGDKRSARMYATASALSDGMLLLCGGRDTSGTPLADAYGLLMHLNGQWEWTLAPGVSPSPRCQHAAIFCYMTFWSQKTLSFNLTSILEFHHQRETSQFLVQDQALLM